MDLVSAFISYNSSRETFKVLIESLQNADPTVALLALEGLYRIEGDVERRQFWDNGPEIENIRAILRKWRCESSLLSGYSAPFDAAQKVLGKLSIFKTLDVPLFIDNYGDKNLLRSYGDKIEDINISGETSIFHDTHSEEAQKICEEKEFKPSDKNIVGGVWFGLDSSQYSVYGSKRFETTLSKIGVKGLRQGEIVAYKHEINVILYAEGHDCDDDANVASFEGLKKPTDAAVKEENLNGYVKVTIFVPLKFFSPQEKFEEVVSGPTQVTHHPFCVRASRLKKTRNDCNELK